MLDPAHRQAVRLALGTASALGLARFAYGLLLPAMRDDLHWNLAEAGAMNTANGLGYLLGALATAVVTRRVSATATFRGGMVLVAAALAATAATGDYPVLLALRAMAGAAGAAVFIAGGVIASRIAARAGSGAPITVYFAGAGLGIAAAGATLPAMAEHWRLAWAALGLAAAASAAASWTAARETIAREARPAVGGRARLRPLAGIAVAYLLFATGYITYITFLSAYLADQRAPLAQVILTWTALGLAVIAAPLLWNGPTARWPGTRALTALLVTLSAGAALALLAPSPPIILASAVLYGATFMGVPAAVTTLIKTTTPPEAWTATLSAFTVLFAAGQTAGPRLAGVLADGTTTEATLAWTAILCAAAAAISASAR
ncbi:YbfB/YjiJ family MFS transporter [Nonomuraea sp. NPDC050663]|uniref:YbfB/YjiJ family MFS transporter n=1 Tax=Nonomuraea sp. NPDC050663 TaxID=3364370 RepID=UPI0037A7D421